MNDAIVIHIALQTMVVAAKLSAPILLTSLAIGFGVSLMQSITQIQEVTLTFVPKMLGVAVAVLVAGPWMLDTLTAYTHEIFTELPTLLGNP